MKRKRLEEIVGTFRQKHVAVIGDLMLDVYVKGNAVRLSPEAPVPVVHVSKRESCLGGAANVMRNLVTLGARVSAFGAVGTDVAGDEVLTHLKSYGINVDGIVRDGSRPTTEKQRILAGHQQVVRVDFEETSPVPRDITDKVVLPLIAMIESGKVDAVIVQDYAKGLLSEGLLKIIVETARKRHIPVALDPHPRQTMRVKGLTVMTPNRLEAFGLAGVYPDDQSLPSDKDEQTCFVGRRIIDEWACDYLLMTLGAQGMALFPRQGEPEHIPTRAREVFDVSGAGDTVIAAFTLAMLGGASAVEAAGFSNHAAGVVVGKLGTATVAIDELLKSYEDWGFEA